jgi:hypothetical protein
MVPSFATPICGERNWNGDSSKRAKTAPRPSFSPTRTARRGRPLLSPCRSPTRPLPTHRSRSKFPPKRRSRSVLMVNGPGSSVMKSIASIGRVMICAQFQGQIQPVGNTGYCPATSTKTPRRYSSNAARKVEQNWPTVIDQGNDRHFFLSAGPVDRCPLNALHPATRPMPYRRPPAAATASRAAAGGC